MKKIITWLKSSNRGRHIVGGFLIGLGADDTLELKDKLWGGKWDWVDFGCTMAGVVVGRLIRVTLTGK